MSMVTAGVLLEGVHTSLTSMTINSRVSFGVATSTVPKDNGVYE
jgi:hypothetical protein